MNISRKKRNIYIQTYEEFGDNSPYFLKFKPKVEIQKIIDTIEDDYNKGKYLKLESVNEDKRANILNIDFTITEKGDNIFFAFKDKKEGIIKIRKIGSNKIVNLLTLKSIILKLN
mgnify:CR=1 FL=1